MQCPVFLSAVFQLTGAVNPLTGGSILFSQTSGDLGGNCTSTPPQRSFFSQSWISAGKHSLHDNHLLQLKPIACFSLAIRL